MKICHSPLEAQDVSADDLHFFATYDKLLEWHIDFYELLVCARPLPEIHPRRQIVKKLHGVAPIAMWPVHKGAGKARSSAEMRYLGIRDGCEDESANYTEQPDD